MGMGKGERGKGKGGVRRRRERKCGDRWPFLVSFSLSIRYLGYLVDRGSQETDVFVSLGSLSPTSLPPCFSHSLLSFSSPFLFFFLLSLFFYFLTFYSLLAASTRASLVS